MRALLFLLAVTGPAAAQPADCATAPPASALPLSIGIAGLPGAPPGLTGQVYLAVPILGSTSCNDVPRPPRDILRGDPPPNQETVLNGPRGNLLRGPAR